MRFVQSTVVCPLDPEPHYETGRMTDERHEC